ncbi:MAG: aquaporin [Planctomycetota bacterium]
MSPATSSPSAWEPITGTALMLLLVGPHETLGASLPNTAAGITLAQTGGMEIVLSWLLMFVILGVSTGAKKVGHLAGIAVGDTVALCALVGGPVSGASMNPARSLGPALLSGHLEQLWIYLVCTVIGTVLAVPSHRFLRQAGEGGCCS